MRVARLDEFLKRAHGLLKLLGEFGLLLIAPGLLLAAKRRANASHLCLHIAVEFLQVGGESAQFSWINNCFGHGITSVASVRFAHNANTQFDRWSMDGNWFAGRYGCARPRKRRGDCKRAHVRRKRGAKRAELRV